jgi:hypothetical protein
MVSLGLFHVDAVGNVYQRGTDGKTIKEVLVFQTETRVVENADLPNTAGYPTVKEYLEREAGDDFQLKEVNQSFVVTEKLT